MMFLSLHGMAIIILRATVTSGKHILTCELCSTVWACCPFLCHWALLFHSRLKKMLWNLLLLWFLGGCSPSGVVGQSFAGQPISSVLRPAEGICWRVCVTPVATSPKLLPWWPGHAQRVWVNLEPWGSTVWNQHTNGSFLHIWKPEKVALESLSIASHCWERNRKSLALSTSLIVQSGWAMCNISHNAMPCHPENVTLLRCSYPVRTWEMGFLSLSRTQKIRCFPGATNVNFMLGFWS